MSMLTVRLCLLNSSSQLPSVPWSSASTTLCRLRHINTLNMPTTAQPCTLKRKATIPTPNSNVDHVSLKPNSAAIVGIASGRIHNTLTHRPLKPACSPPNRSLPASCSIALTNSCDSPDDQAPREPRQAKPAELDGAQQTPQPVSLALHHRGQEKRYPDDRHIRSWIGTYPPSGNVRVILALDEF
jgi:hypothetical protein